MLVKLANGDMVYKSDPVPVVYSDLDFKPSEVRENIAAGREAYAHPERLTDSRQLDWFMKIVLKK